MKRLFTILLTFVAVGVAYGQNLNISLEGEVEEVSGDLDARAYYPKKDLNDNLCALIKVTLTNPLKNPLVLETGGLGVVDRVVQESGEVWFYVPAQVKNLSFKCAEYAPMDPIPVRLKAGTVFRLTLNPDAIFETISNATLSTNYLKIEVNEPNATISLGHTQQYELLYQGINGTFYSQLLEYGDYYYKIEHPLRETYYGHVKVDEATSTQNVSLAPAYGYLTVETSPSGASLFIDGRMLGKTPYSVEQRLAKGNVEVRLALEDYHNETLNVQIVGDGTRQTLHKDLKPRFAVITFECPDRSAEIWIDNVYKGKGTWSGRLNSLTSHLVETRRAGHRSQSVKINVVDGENRTYTLQAPVALYGTLNLTTSPHGCSVVIDGQKVGETPYIGQLIVGNHNIELSKNGYIRKEVSCYIEHNKTHSMNETLQKGRLKANVTISCGRSAEDIYVNNKRLGSGYWSGTLEEGRHIVEVRRSGYKSQSKVLRIEDSSPQHLLFDELEITAMKRLNRWCFSEYSHDYESKYFAEATWNGDAWGANFGMFFGDDQGGHLGLHASLANVSSSDAEQWNSDSSSGDIDFTLGPLIRSEMLGDVETQFFAGVGYSFAYEEPKYEVGMRLSYDINDTLWGLSSLSFGVESVAGELFPKVGLSFLPGLLGSIDFDIDFDPEEVVIGADMLIDFYDNVGVGATATIFPGFNYLNDSWWGWYGSLGYFFDSYDPFYATGGVSLSIAGGFGLSLTAGLGYFGGGFGWEWGYSLFGCTMKMLYADGEMYGLTVGFSLPILDNYWDLF